MLKSIKELFNLLTFSQKKFFFKLQILVVFMSLVEVLGVVSIGPFMALIGNFELLEGTGVLATLYQYSNIDRPENFIILVGIFVLVILTFGSMLSMYVTWKVSIFGSKTGMELGYRLFNYYMNQTWLFHASENSSNLSKKIAVEATRVTDTIIQPIMQLNARIVTAFFISVGLFFYNPLIALAGILIFSISYFILYSIVKSRLKNNGQVISELTTSRFKLMNEGFGGIKETILLNKQEYFTNKFNVEGERLAYSQGSNKALSEMPRFFMELVAFGSIIILILYLLNSRNGDLSDILQTLSIYALASFKLLPAFQQTYRSVSTIRGNLSAFDIIKPDLIRSKQVNTPNIKTQDSKELIFNKFLEFKNLSYSYPLQSKKVLNGLNIKIPVNTTIGIVGSTGSGKSTTIDLLLGLLKQDEGDILIDGNELCDNNLKQWQSKIGFVPQSIFISDATIMENIAFGVNINLIDMKKINHVIQLAHLESIIKESKEGIYTNVGERGVQLSGGQRQRIGIARALYHDAEVLVFDEATSALDSITEKTIMDAIDEFSGKKTIILIAHRITTLKNCDNIIILEDGKVVDEGSYSELLNNNKKFKNMANI